MRWLEIWLLLFGRLNELHIRAWEPADGYALLTLPPAAVHLLQDFNAIAHLKIKLVCVFGLVGKLDAL